MKKMRMVIDTETCPLDRTFNGVSAENMFAYDIGYVIVDRFGEIYLMRSFVNADVFLNEKELMSSAYYADKIPQYWEDIKNGKRILTSWANICKTVREDLKAFNVSEVYAHNMRFDYGTLNNTNRWETKSKFRFFFPNDVEICDTLKLSRQLIAPMKSYKEFCEENNYLTKTGRVKLTAEVLYRFISGNNEFIEEHKGLEDVLIEKEILAYCFRKHKAMNGKMWDKANA